MGVDTAAVSGCPPVWVQERGITSLVGAVVAALFITEEEGPEDGREAKHVSKEGVTTGRGVRVSRGFDTIDNAGLRGGFILSPILEVDGLGERRQPRAASAPRRTVLFVCGGRYWHLGGLVVGDVRDGCHRPSSR